MTLLELLIATSIMAIMSAVLGSLALCVQMQSRFSQGQGEAVQHARVVLDRLQRHMQESNVSPQFPGFAVFADQVSGKKYPDTLVIWSPTTFALAPNGLPRWNELLIVCPDPKDPGTLVEIRDPTDTRVVPSLNNTATWRIELYSVKRSASVQKIELTPLLRTGVIGTSNSGSPIERGAIRFDLRQRPSDAQWQDYKNGSLAWDEIDWVQGIYGTKTGLRQVWCRIELQLDAGSAAEIDDETSQSAITFFGSAAIYHELRK
jgi:type II secretory pathway pseudopilin PulG